MAESFPVSRLTSTSHVNLLLKRRRRVASLNEQSDRHTSYKVLFLARHGEGYHNVVSSSGGLPKLQASGLTSLVRPRDCMVG